MKRFLFLGVVFCLTILTTPCFGQGFETSDLEGTWYAYFMEANPMAGTFWVYGSFTVDDDGDITGGTYKTADGTTVNVTGGQASLDGDGLLTGTIESQGAGTTNIPSGKMDAGKTVISFVGADTQNSMGLGIAIKGGKSFSTDDIEGTWYAYLMETNPVTGTYWLHATLIVDDEGTLTGGSYTAPDGTTVSVTGGQASLDADGLLSGTVTAQGGLTGNFPYGKMDAGKTVISMVGVDSLGSQNLAVAVKAGGSFSTKDLEGTWYVYLFETNPATGSYWLYGNFTVDDAGKVTGGKYTAPDGATVDVTGGQAGISADGFVTATIEAGDGGTGTIPTGKMDVGKTFISFVGTDTQGSLDLGVAIKRAEAGSGGTGGGSTCFIDTLMR